MASITTTAVAEEDGSGYVINGMKKWITFGCCTRIVWSGLAPLVLSYVAHKEMRGRRQVLHCRVPDGRLWLGRDLSLPAGAWDAGALDAEA